MAAASHAAPVASFDDIQHWVGQGANQAAVVIDWDEAAGQGGSLAWGFRWDGEATGRDMLLAAITADDHLYAKLDTVEARLFGLGYDRNEPSSFGITSGAAFDERGVTLAPQTQADGAAASDPLDLYGEGWFLNFWHYASQPAGFDSAWESNQQGYATRPLTDGAIDGWTFATVFNYSAYPDPPVPAPFSLPGDYNADGSVDAADYTVWRDGESPAHSDYLLWRDHYQPATASPADRPLGVVSAPEPRAALLLLFAGVCIAGARLHCSHQLGTTS